MKPTHIPRHYGMVRVYDDNGKVVDTALEPSNNWLRDALKKGVFAKEERFDGTYRYWKLSGYRIVKHTP